jgi:hypothetical protein
VLTLAEYQKHFLRQVLATDPIAASSGADDHPLDVGFMVHQVTVFGALSRVLKLRFPTACALVGDEAFEAIARDYVRLRPPDFAVLQTYGNDFPDYLGMRAEAAPNPSYLKDVALFDFLIDTTVNKPLNTFGPPVPLGTDVEMRILSSAACLTLSIAADELRDAAQEILANLPRTFEEARSPHHYVFWRTANGVTVKRLSDAAAAFLSSLIAGQRAAEAILLAAEHSGADNAVRAVQAEIFASSFVELAHIR